MKSKTKKIKFDSIEKGKRSLSCKFFGHDEDWLSKSSSVSSVKLDILYYICRKCGKRSIISIENLRKQ